MSYRIYAKHVPFTQLTFKILLLTTDYYMHEAVPKILSNLIFKTVTLQITDRLMHSKISII